MANAYFLLLFVTFYGGLTFADTDMQEEFKCMKLKLKHLETRVNYLEHEVTSQRLEKSNISGSLEHFVRSAGRSKYMHNPNELFLIVF